MESCNNNIHAASDGAQDKKVRVRVLGRGTRSKNKLQSPPASKPAFVYCVFSTIFGFEPSPTVLCDRDPDFIIQSVVGLYLD